MARKLARFTVGRRSLGASKRMSPYEPGYTRAIRQQMDRLEKAITGSLNAVDGLTPGAIRHVLKPIYDTSQVLVPVDTTALKESGFIRVEKKSAGATGVVGYGEAGDPFYAVIVHERTELNHAGKTQAKYLEEAVSKHISSTPRRLQQYFRNSLGRR